MNLTGLLKLIEDIQKLPANIEAEADRTKRNVEKAIHLAVNKAVKDQHLRNVINNAIDIVVNAEVDDIEADVEAFVNDALKKAGLS